VDRSWEGENEEDGRGKVMEGELGLKRLPIQRIRTSRAMTMRMMPRLKKPNGIYPC